MKMTKPKFIKDDNNAFSWVFEGTVESGEENAIILRMPAVTANRRAVNDIGWQVAEGGNVTLYGTLARRPDKNESIWQEINPFDDVNKTVSAIMVKNEGEKSVQVAIRVVMY